MVIVVVQTMPVCISDRT